MKRWVFLLVLAIYGSAIEPVYGENSECFYRIVSTQRTRILSFGDNAVLSWTNVSSNASCRIEWSTSLSGGWSAIPSLTNAIATGTVGRVSVPRMNEAFTTTGTVVYLSFEGGFYGVIGDDGGAYDPFPYLPLELSVSGTRVILWAIRHEEWATIHMWGIPVEILNVTPL